MNPREKFEYAGPALGLCEVAERYRVKKDFLRRLIADAEIDIGKRRILMPAEITMFVQKYGHWGDGK